MAQLNLHVTAEFQEKLQKFRKLRGLPSKSEAVRVAVGEALEREEQRTRPTDFRQWIGLGNRSPKNPSPRFTSDDDLWA